MISVQPARERPKDRIPTESAKPVTQQIAKLPAPVAGWISNQNLASQEPASAYVLDNFWVTANSIRPRGGYEQRVGIAREVVSLHNYSAGNEFFVADDTSIYKFDANTAQGTTLTAVASGKTSGAWQGIETQNDAGSFLTLVNGADNLHLYDGTTHYTVTDVSATHAITGVDTANLKFAWNYSNRTWFVEKDSMNAWYLGTNSVSGLATKFPLGGVFNKGGKLHSGAVFSSDSGDGLDDRIVFLTDQGEIAIYSGDDPGGNFSKVGVYEVGVPLSTNPFVRVGGDVMICTKSGLIPLTGAVRKDPSELKVVSVSRQIEPDWEYWATLQPSGWHVTKWEERGVAVFAVPGGYPPFAFVLNLETGAWVRWTNWRANAVSVLGGRLYLANGTDVFLADTTGADNGTPVTASMCYSFQGFADTSAHKAAKRVRGAFRRNLSFNPQFSVAVDYSPSLPSAPSSIDVTAVDGAAIWGVAPWGQTNWATAGLAKSAKAQWHVVSGHGFALAVQLQITSDANTKLDAELVAIDLAYTVGDA